MKKALVFIISIVATLIICGVTPQNIALSTLAVTIFLWIKALKNIKSVFSHAINNPQLHNPELVTQILDRCLEETKSSKKEISLLLSNPGINTLTIRAAAERAITVNDSHRALSMENGELWIADHPLPLILKPREHQQLNFSPASDGRIRVSTETAERSLGMFFLTLIPIAAILFFFNFHCAAAALIAPLIHTLLSRGILKKAASR